MESVNQNASTPSIKLWGTAAAVSASVALPSMGAMFLLFLKWIKDKQNISLKAVIGLSSIACLLSFALFMFLQLSYAKYIDNRSEILNSDLSVRKRAICIRSYRVIAACVFAFIMMSANILSLAINVLRSAQEVIAKKMKILIITLIVSFVVSLIALIVAVALVGVITMLLHANEHNKVPGSLVRKSSKHTLTKINFDAETVRKIESFEKNQGIHSSFQDYLEELTNLVEVYRDKCMTNDSLYDDAKLVQYHKKVCLFIIDLGTKHAKYTKLDTASFSAEDEQFIESLTNSLLPIARVVGIDPCALWGATDSLSVREHHKYKHITEALVRREESLLSHSMTNPQVEVMMQECITQLLASVAEIFEDAKEISIIDSAKMTPNIIFA